MPVIRIKNSTTASAVPSGLAAGELAYNIPDNKLYVGNGSSSVLIQSSLGSQNSNSVNITGGNINGTPIGATTKSSLTTSSLQINGSSALALADTANPLNSTNSNTPTQAAVKAYVDAKRGAIKNMYAFTSSGTYTKSGSDVTLIRVICVGAGGGGRGYGESGGAGGYAELLINATSISTVAVTVAGNTSGGGYYGSGNGGGTTSFGGYVSASGGYGANDNQSHSGGHGGVGYGGNINIRGGGGTGHRNCHSNSHHNGGMGGASFFGGGQSTSHYGHGNDTPDVNIQAFGAGGPGNSHNSIAGTGGKAGICIVYEYK